MAKNNKKLTNIKDFLLILGEGTAFAAAILSLIFTSGMLLSSAIIISSLTLFIVAILNKKVK